MEKKYVKLTKKVSHENGVQIKTKWVHVYGNNKRELEAEQSRKQKLYEMGLLKWQKERLELCIKEYLTKKLSYNVNMMLI